MGTFPEPETGPLEEHLLISGDCRDRLRETDEFVAAMRAAAAKPGAAKAAKKTAWEAVPF
jgi:hypothetical protein